MPRDQSGRRPYQKAYSSGNSSSNQPEEKKKNRRKRVKRNEALEDAEAERDTMSGSGVNKIKSAIRQTKRLLSKDSILASTRTDAERKLVALEDELEKRQFGQRERKNSTRYHKVRFFERQKLTKKIGKIKKQLSNESLDDKKKVVLESELENSRVLLNYVLHYPMTQKYIALFPNQGPSPLDEEKAGEDEGNKKSRKTMNSIKKQIEEAMKKGELSETPEIDLENRMKDDGDDEDGLLMEKKKSINFTLDNDSKPSSGNPRKKQKVEKDKEISVTTHNLEDDDFFA